MSSLRWIAAKNTFVHQIATSRSKWLKKNIAMQIWSEEVNLEAAEGQLTATQDKSNVKQVGYDLTNVYHPIFIFNNYYRVYGRLKRGRYGSVIKPQLGPIMTKKCESCYLKALDQQEKVEFINKT